MAGVAWAVLAGAVLASGVPASATAAGPAKNQGKNQVVDQVAVGDVQRAMADLATTDGVVGTIGEVYVDGNRVGKGSAGSRLLDGKGGRIPTDARYRIGSQTKLMTGTVVLQLVQEGRLSLDDKLAVVLPEVVQQDLVERAGEITVRQLLDHTSGIPNFADAGIDQFDFTTYYSPTDIVKKSRALPRTGEPGEKVSYSNTNYFLLGMIIEKVTGHSVPDEMNHRLFQPLGMNNTYLPTAPPEGIVGPHGHGYLPDAQGTPRDVDRQNASYGYAAGGVISTAHDLSAFYRAFSQGTLLPPGLQQVIAPPLGMCRGTFRMLAGHFPGFNAATFSSADGRTQFAVSTTVKVDDPAAMNVGMAQMKAAETVLCPRQ